MMDSLNQRVPIATGFFKSALAFIFHYESMRKIKYIGYSTHMPGGDLGGDNLFKEQFLQGQEKIQRL